MCVLTLGSIPQIYTASHLLLNTLSFLSYSWHQVTLYIFVLFYLSLKQITYLLKNHNIFDSQISKGLWKVLFTVRRETEVQ